MTTEASHLILTFACGIVVADHLGCYFRARRAGESDRLSLGVALLFLLLVGLVVGRAL